MSDKPEIVSYLDFRVFLKDYLEFYRKKRGAFRFQTLVEEFGFKTRSHYIDVLKGRKLSKRYLSCYIRFCEFSEDQADYFEALVAYNQENLPSKKAVLFDRLVETAPHLQTLQLEQEIYSYFSKWYYPVVLSLIDLNPKEYDCKRLSQKSKYPLKATEAKEALIELKKLGFIKWNDVEYQWEFVKKFFKATKGAQSAALTPFHHEMQNLGIAAYQKDYENQVFSTLTLSMSEKTKEEIISMMAEFRKSILNKVKEDSNSEVVMQINMQTFPLSKNLADKNENEKK